MARRPDPPPAAGFEGRATLSPGDRPQWVRSASCGDVAQPEEHRVRIAGVRGSSPLISTTPQPSVSRTWCRAGHALSRKSMSAGSQSTHCIGMTQCGSRVGSMARTREIRRRRPRSPRAIGSGIPQLELTCLPVRHLLAAGVTRRSTASRRPAGHRPRAAARRRAAATAPRSGTRTARRGTPRAGRPLASLPVRRRR